MSHSALSSDIIIINFKQINHVFYITFNELDTSFFLWITNSAIFLICLELKHFLTES